MGTLEIVEDNSPATLKRRATALLKEATAAAQSSCRSSLLVGWIGAEVKRERLFQAMGFDGESEFRQHLGVGRSTWFRYVRLAESLKKLPKEDFLKLRAENADYLIDLPEEQRYNTVLIKNAQEMKEEDFEKVTRQFRAEEDQIDEADVIVLLKYRMPESRRSVIKDTIKWFAEDHDLDIEDESRTLELICAEIRFRNPVVTRAMRATQQLREAHELLTGNSGDLSADEVMAKADQVVGQVIRGMAEAAGPST